MARSSSCGSFARWRRWRCGLIYWFFWSALVPIIPFGEFDVVALFILFPMSVVATYNLLSMTIPGQKYLWDLRRRIR